MSGITDDELLLLARLIREQEISDQKKELLFYNDEWTKNYLFLRRSFEAQTYVNDELVDGFKGVVLEGGGRSAKTWSAVFFIVHLCLHVETSCTINIIRETYNEFKTTLYLDFKKILPMFGLPNPFESVQDIASYRIGKNQINFIGADQSNKVHGATSDYLYFNEVLPVKKVIFKNLIMRCSKMWFCDFNPSVTEHWIFDEIIPRLDVGHLRTTFRDNPKVPVGQKIEILGYEPWLPGSYQVIDDQIWYNDQPVDDHNQPPPHPTNVENGTVDLFMWKVYGLGLRGAMEGVIFQNVRYVDAFPEDMGDYIYGNDFGFTTDPNATVKYFETEKEIWVELLLYQPMETPEVLDAYFDSIGMKKSKRIVCDSSDKYTSDKRGTIEFVSGMQDLQWDAFKVEKYKSVMYWILSMKKKRINVVRNGLEKFAKKEAENYKMKEIHGKLINQPIDDFNHFWDATRYCHMVWSEPKGITTRTHRD